MDNVAARSKKFKYKSKKDIENQKNKRKEIEKKIVEKTNIEKAIL